MISRLAFPLSRLGSGCGQVEVRLRRAGLSVQGLKSLSTVFWQGLMNSVLCSCTPTESTIYSPNHNNYFSLFDGVAECREGGSGSDGGGCQSEGVLIGP